MRSKIFDSFRINIAVYTLISLLLTVLTEVIILFILNISIFRFDKRDIENFSINPPPMKEISIITVIVIVCLGVAFFIFYFFILTNRMTKNVADITNNIQNISKGDFDSKIYIKGNDEFAIISDSLNKMSGELKEIMLAERKAEQTKNELITNVAHDLKTPLTSIIGYLELVTKSNNLDEETKNNYLNIAYNKSRRLEKLIEDLFSFTKFSFGEVQLEKTEINLVQFIYQLLDEFYPSFQDNNLKYSFRFSHNEINVQADINLLVRAFANLIENAIKYGKDGKIVKIKITVDELITKFEITNYGEVIPEKDINNIFDKFYRVEQSRSNETGGTGLGLAIAKSIIQMHNGKLYASSDLKGTVFTVELPIYNKEIKTDEKN